MNHPGGGFNDVPDRIKRQFFSFNMTEPSNKAVNDIYKQILNYLTKVGKYGPEITTILSENIIDATIAVWTATSDKLLKTPAKFHYNFSIRELSRVFQGICGVVQASQYNVIQRSLNRKEKPAPSPELFLVGLWRHECLRVFADKLVNA